jgi:hypothetical protein
MTIQKVNIGSVVNDGTGDDLRTAFVKVNNNFDQLADTLTLVNSNDILVRYMNDMLTNFDFGSFVGSTPIDTGIFQIMLQSIDFELGTITSPGKYDLDLGGITNTSQQSFIQYFIQNLDGGTA